MENKDKQIAVIETDKGTIRFRLYDSAAPKTVANFVKLTESGFYDGVKFHRVIEDFMIQTGDPLSRDESKKDQWGTGGSGNKFDDEINPWSLELDAGTIRSLQEQGYVYNRNLSSRKNTVGAVSMANSGPNTNDSQFFIITQKDQPHLNGKHTVFGEVIEGMETVLAIRQDDIIKKITIEKEGEKTDTKTITEDVSSDANNIISNPTIEATTTSGQPIKIELAE
ncbi:peptidylprolyl isomerase [Candidatus Microgenomates bacterium]|nr:peptidylprolyl isomerase [Candidatus Microgenomates bacterium]